MVLKTPQRKFEELLPDAAGSAAATSGGGGLSALPPPVAPPRTPSGPSPVSGAAAVRRVPSSNGSVGREPPSPLSPAGRIPRPQWSAGAD